MKLLSFVPWSKDWYYRKNKGKWKNTPDYGKFKSGYKPTHKIVSLKSKIYFGKNDKIKSSKSYLPFLSEIEILKSKRHMVMFEKDKWVKRKEILPLNSKFNNYKEIF